jgi:acyl carrier protein
MEQIISLPNGKPYYIERIMEEWIMTFEKVAQMLAEYKDIDVSVIKPESTFEELEVDSLDMVELVMNMEEEFGVTIEMDEGLKTVQDVVNLIDASK